MERMIPATLSALLSLWQATQADIVIVAVLLLLGLATLLIVYLPELLVSVARASFFLILDVAWAAGACWQRWTWRRSWQRYGRLLAMRQHQREGVARW